MAEQETGAAASLHELDVVVVGGAFSGASTALLLRRRLPAARILVIERQERFGRKVGEATVEISGLFLTRVLGLYDHLVREHLPKHGLRFWFSDGEQRRLEELTEIGPHKVSAYPSFQLDRSRLDEEILRRAASEGVEVWRPAKVTGVDLGWPASRLTVEGADGTERTVAARWVVDGSGRQTFLGRRLGVIEKVDEHPTAAAWGRWTGVADLDSVAVQGVDARHPRLAPLAAARRLATNHFCGYGWWCWAIPLGGGETSVGVVFDKRHFDWPTAGRLQERYVDFVTRRVPGLRDLLAEATLDEDDFLAYQHLPYRARRYAGRGWALVGDAASFLDPYYSPGLDHAGISAFATTGLIGDELEGKLDETALDRRLADHNGAFDRSYGRWMAALYLDKYEILGDAELVTASFLFDTGMYYLGVVGPAAADLDELANPVLGLDLPQARLAAAVMSLFRRRMVALARFRRSTGRYGRRNVGWRYVPPRFDPSRPQALTLVRAALGHWWRAERQLLWWRLRHGRLDLSMPVPSPPVGVTAEG